jgi:hypothetical protein
MNSNVRLESDCSKSECENENLPEETIYFLQSPGMMLIRSTTLSISLIRRTLLNTQWSIRWITVPSSKQLESTMKKLIDIKAYDQALNLFDRNVSNSTDIARALALKACSKLHDIQRGKEIHQLLSNQSLQDSSIQTSLIHFYSTLYFHTL